jgi:hypothetical protein
MPSPGFTHRFLPDDDLILHSPPSVLVRPRHPWEQARAPWFCSFRRLETRPVRVGVGRSNVGFQPVSQYRVSDGFDSLQPRSVSQGMRSDRSGQADHLERSLHGCRVTQNKPRLAPPVSMRPIPPMWMMGPMSLDPNRAGEWRKGIVAMVPDLMVPAPHPGARNPVIAGSGRRR